MTGTLHEHQDIFLITSHQIFVRMKNVLDKSVEKIKTHILYSMTSFPKIVPFMRKCGKIL